MTVNAAFDIGNVICHFDINKFTSKLSSMTSMNDREAYFFLEYLQKMQDIGVTSVAHGLERRCDLRGDELRELIDCWNSTVYPDEIMLRFLSNLRSEGVKIAFLSNMGPEHIAHLRTTYPDIFDNAVQHISCEVGARKPTKLFFQSFCLDHDSFLGSVYVDDIEENLRAGKKYGFKVYQFRLDDLMRESKATQKRELDKLRSMIFQKM